ncbi:Cys-tRNA(Pro) deacylase [Olsenella sp. KGMB02461]|nr:Cys-tRNA(Pro) deacylase [Olsenella sp. KGMB02461]
MSKRSQKIDKTNACRELDRAKIAYELKCYDDAQMANRDYGLSVAEALGEDPDSAFKTITCKSSNGDVVVCCVPCSCSVDLKKAAIAAKEKRLELLPLADLEEVTGYVRGGCSPIGMKRPFPTIIDETALLYDTIEVSAGRRGLQLILEPQQLIGFLGAIVADIT